MADCNQVMILANLSSRISSSWPKTPALKKTYVLLCVCVWRGHGDTIRKNRSRINIWFHVQLSGRNKWGKKKGKANAGEISNISCDFVFAKLSSEDKKRQHRWSVFCFEAWGIFVVVATRTKWMQLLLWMCSNYSASMFRKQPYLTVC